MPDPEEVECDHCPDGWIDSKELSINVVSIVAGALIVLTLMTWISFFKVLCEDVLQDDSEDRYGAVLWRKLLSAVIITLISGVVVAGLYLWKRG